MFIRTIAHSLLDAFRDLPRLADQDPFELLSTFGASLLEEEEVDDEPPQPGNRILGASPLQRPKAVYAI